MLGVDGRMEATSGRSGRWFHGLVIRLGAMRISDRSEVGGLHHRRSVAIELARMLRTRSRSERALDVADGCPGRP